MTGRMWLTLALVAAGGGGFWTAGTFAKDDDVMTEPCIAQYGPSTSDAQDRARIEALWQDTLPSDVRELGGLDWTGWARICPAGTGEAGLFQGTYWDLRTRYAGLWRLSRVGGLPEHLPSDGALLADYALDNYANGRLELRAFDLPGQPVAFLVPTEPARIEAAPGQ